MINFKITPEEWKEVMEEVQEPTPLMQDLIDLSLQEEYIIFPNGSKITFGKGVETARNDVKEGRVSSVEDFKKRLSARKNTD